MRSWMWTALLVGGMAVMNVTFAADEKLPLTWVVTDFGAVGDGVADNTTAFQSAIDKAAEKGGIVSIPAGRFTVAGSVQVKPGVTVKGVAAAPVSPEPLIGSVILATGGRDNESAAALFEMGHASTVTGITIWYPEQKPTDIHPYPWTFHLYGFDNTVENVTLINSYNGIKVGPEPNVRHRIRSVYGCVLRRGLFVDTCSDIGRVEDVQFHCHWWTAPSIGGDWKPVFDYMVANLEAFVFGRTDWEYAMNNFVFPAKIGWRFIKTDAGACNGQFTGNGADACETAVQVDAIQPMGLLITGGQFVAFTGKDPVEVRISDTCAGNVRFVNCAFWGPALHNAVIKGKGYVSFSDCYFSSDYQETKDSPLLVVESGRLQVNNSTFATEQPGIALAPTVTHAVIQGNNGASGVRVIDNTGGKAVLTNNEAPPPPK